LRNKIRHRLIPIIEREFNPRLRRALIRTAQILTQENDYLQCVAVEKLECVLDAQSGAINIAELKKLHPAVQQRIIKLALARCIHSTEGIYYEHVLAIMRIIASEAGTKEINLPHSLIARREYGRLFLHQASVHTKVQFAYLVTVPSTLNLPSAKIELRFSLTDRGAIDFSDNNTAFLDYNKVQAPLTFRSWQPGYTIKPLGMGGQRKKLQDIFTDKKIPAQQRACVPILTDAKSVLWIPRIAMSDEVRITTQTTRVLKIVIA
jgi:tRNA(Ile)-lysidine synthase